MGGDRLDAVMFTLAFEQIDRAGADRSGGAEQRHRPLGGYCRRLRAQVRHGHGTTHKRSPCAAEPRLLRAIPKAAATAAAARKPSSRSMTPPWPGINFPASLAPKRRLIADSNRSPAWATAESSKATMPMKIMFSIANNFATATAAISAPMRPPTAPDQVLLGLTLGASFGPPMARPAK